MGVGVGVASQAKRGGVKTDETRRDPGGPRPEARSLSLSLSTDLVPCERCDACERPGPGLGAEEGRKEGQGRRLWSGSSRLAGGFRDSARDCGSTPFRFF